VLHEEEEQKEFCFILAKERREMKEKR